jgi:hypothetical protein
VVKIQRDGSLNLDLDLSSLTVTFQVTGEECTAGTCLPFMPDSIPLKGTLAPYTGPGSIHERSSGNLQNESFGPYGIVWSNTFSGNRTRSTARFTGMVGPVTLSPPDVGTDGFLTISKGQETFATVYPPMP